MVAVTVKYPLGTARGNLTIVGGPHKLALTPPMGWNSWLVWAGVLTDAKVRAAADAMVKFGLAAHGFQYVNIDDTWAAPRRQGRNPVQQPLSRHEGPGRLCPQQGAEAGNLFLARPLQLRRLHRQLPARARTPRPLPAGASTI